MTTEVTGGPIPQELTGRYRLGEARSTSPISVLYPGRDLKTDAPVMVKLLRTSAITAVAERQRVRREFLKLAPIRHPNLCPVLAAGESDDVLWMVRPALPGHSAQELLAQGRRFTPAEAAYVGARVAGALAELHKQGILHRDLRPGHVILGPQGAVQVLDGALGRLFRNDEGRVVAGQPGYAAPEAIQGKLVSFRSDLYSLGALVYELATGAPPYAPLDAADTLRRQCEADAPALPESAPTALGRMVASLLARDPRERPFSAQQLERQFEPLAQAPEVPATEAPGLPPAGSAGVALVEALAPAAAAPLAAPGAVDDDADDFDVPVEVTTGGPSPETAVVAPSAAPARGTPPPVPHSASKAPPPPPAAALLKGARATPPPAAPLATSSTVPAPPAVADRPVSELDALADLVVVPTPPQQVAPVAPVAPPGPPVSAFGGGGGVAQGIAFAAAAPAAAPVRANGHAMPEAPLAVVPFDDDDPEAPTRVSSVQELGSSMAEQPAAAAPEASPPGPWGPKLPSVPPLPAGAPARGTLPGVVPIPGAPRTSHATLMGYSNGAALDAAALAANAASVVNQDPLSGPPAPPPATAEHSGNIALPGRREPLDYDDMMDTVVNEDSRVFGNPLDPSGALGGTAVPPLPGDLAQQVITGGAIPAPAPSAGIPGPQGWAQPAYHPAVAAPMPATASMPPGGYPTMQASPYTMPPGYGPQSWAPAQRPPSKGIGILPVILLAGAAFGMISVAGIGSFFYARHRAQAAEAASPPTLTVVPPTPVTLPSQPEAQPTPTQPSPAQPSPVRAQNPAPTAQPEPPSAPSDPREPRPVRSHAGSPTPVIHVRDPQATAHTPPPAPTAPTPVVAPPRTPVAVAPAVRPTQPAVVPVAPPRPGAPATAVQAPIPQGPPEQMFAEAIRRRDWAQARGFAANMVRANPGSAPAHARLADMMERTGDARAALNEYRTALRIDGRNVGYLHRLAALQLSTGDRSGAIQSFRQILQSNPNDQGAQARLRALGVNP